MKKIVTILAFVFAVAQSAMSAERFVSFNAGNDAVCLTDKKGAIAVDANDWKGVHIAVENLKKDLQKVTGSADYQIVIGTLGKSEQIDKLAKKNSFIAKELKGKNEKFIITYIDGTGLVIAGSDKRGTIYGIYELSQQAGVSPWYDWADVPVEKHSTLYINKGIYTDGEPAVKYRGIFLNDEAPALSGWAAEFYGGKFNSKFYARVFELVLRLKGNFMWPAMWGSAFYIDDPDNMQTADDMGVMMGTSHHEPMARAQQEWTRVKTRGAWNYDTNQKELDEFWKGGVARMKDTEDVVTVGMRGNGDEPMGENVNVSLLERIVSSQRQLIEEATGKPAKETPQVWALYKEVQEYYEKGMKVPDDVILLLCDDNWGNVRILPELGADANGNATDPASAGSPWAKRHPGGYGMYYHVDYVGAPRSSKWINISQVQRMWEQLQLTYTYGVDKLWILNVGDLKPMEFPIDFWFKMAWNPDQFNAGNLYAYTEDFCRQQFGEKYAKEAARLLNLQCKLVHRRTAEQLDANTYKLKTGEWKERVDEYQKLNDDAVALGKTMPEEMQAAYYQLVLHQIEAMANLYQMYYAQAMNKFFADNNDRQANVWADKVEACFKRDQEITDYYNHTLSNGKWNHFMDQTHIGYRSWNDPRNNICPRVVRPEDPSSAEYELKIEPSKVIAIEADAFTAKKDAAKAAWTVIPDMGVFKCAVALMPYTESTKDASLTYEFDMSGETEADITLYFATTFPFNSGRGQRVAVSVDGSEAKEVNINYASKYVVDAFHDMNYEWEKIRMNKQKMTMPLKGNGKHKITIAPLEPGVVLERIEIQ